MVLQRPHDKTTSAASERSRADAGAAMLLNESLAITFLPLIEVTLDLDLNGVSGMKPPRDCE